MPMDSTDLKVVREILAAVRSGDETTHKLLRQFKEQDDKNQENLIKAFNRVADSLDHSRLLNKGKESMKKYRGILYSFLALWLFSSPAWGMGERPMPSASSSSSSETSKNKEVNEAVLVRVVVENPHNDPAFDIFDQKQLEALVLYSLNSQFSSPSMQVRAVASELPSDAYAKPEEKREGGKLYVLLKIIFHSKNAISIKAFLRIDDGGMQERILIKMMNLPDERNARMKKMREVLDGASADIANAVNCISGGICRKGFKL